MKHSVPLSRIQTVKATSTQSENTVNATKPRCLHGAAFLAGALLSICVGSACADERAKPVTGVDGFPLSYTGAFNCGENVSVELKKGFQFRVGPGIKFKVIKHLDGGVSPVVLARVGDWLDLEGSIDVWVNIKDAYIVINKALPIDFDPNDKCLAGVEIRYFDKPNPRGLTSKGDKPE